MIGTQFIKQQIDEGHLLLREIPLSPQPAKMEVVNPQRVSGFFCLCSPTFRFFREHLVNILGDIWETWWEHFRCIWTRFGRVFTHFGWIL